MWLQERLVSARLEARDLHRRFGVESIEHVDVEGFAERLKVQVVDSPLHGALAQLAVNRRRTRILVSDRLVDPAIRRVAIAHELGHLVLKHPSAKPCDLDRPSLHPRPRSFKTPGSPQAPDLEYEADCFALELLTPKCTVDAYRGRDPDLALCSELALSAWVPMDYAAVRIAETSDRVCAAVLSEREPGLFGPTRARIRWVAASRAFAAVFGAGLVGRLREGQLLDPGTLASRILERSTPCKPGPVPAEAWLGSEGRSLTEASAPLGPRGGMLTMLWAAELETVVTSAVSSVASRYVH